MSGTSGRECFIYVLRNPDTKEIRYVGKTCHPKTRLNFHIANARRCAVGNGARTRASNWILGLLNDGRLPEMEIIISCTEDPDKAERETIAAFRAVGYCLTNLTDGGDGCSGHKVSMETRKLIGDALRGKKKTLSCEQRQAIAIRSRQKWAAYQATLSPEEKSRIASARATAQWKRRTPEEKQAIFRAMVIGRKAQLAAAPPKEPKQKQYLSKEEISRRLSISHMGQTQGARAKWAKPGERERMAEISRKLKQGDRTLANYRASLSSEEKAAIQAKTSATKRAKKAASADNLLA